MRRRRSMKAQSSLSVLLLSVFVLSGCVSAITLKHPDTGHEVTCHGGLTRTGWILLYGLAGFSDGLDHLTLRGQRGQGAGGSAVQNLNAGGGPRDAAAERQWCIKE